MMEGSISYFVPHSKEKNKTEHNQLVMVKRRRRRKYLALTCSSLESAFEIFIVHLVLTFSHHSFSNVKANWIS